MERVVGGVFDLRLVESLSYVDRDAQDGGRVGNGGSSKMGFSLSIPGSEEKLSYLRRLFPRQAAR